MGLFGFGKKKQPAPSQSLPPLPDISSQQDLPPLPPLTDIPAGLPGSPEYERFNDSLAQGFVPAPASPSDQTPLGFPPLPPPQDDTPQKYKDGNVDWTAPVEHPDRLPDDTAGAQVDAQADGNEEHPAGPYGQEREAQGGRQEFQLPPLPDLVESSLNQQHPSPSSSAASPPASPDAGEDHEGNDDHEENLINIELPAFEGEDVHELPKIPETGAAPARFVPARKEFAPSQVPSSSSIPMRIAASAPMRPAPARSASAATSRGAFKDMEPSLPIYHHVKSDVDIFVDVNEYANIVKSMQQLRKSLNARTSRLGQLLQTQENEQVQFHDFHALLESNQRMIMKIDRIIFESNEPR